MTKLLLYRLFGVVVSISLSLNIFVIATKLLPDYHISHWYGGVLGGLMMLFVGLPLSNRLNKQEN